VEGLCDAQTNDHEPDGATAILEHAGGTSLMRALKDNGFDEVMALCGGNCSCATCHVYVGPGLEAKIPNMGMDEDDLLSALSHRRPNSRLSCQIPFVAALDGLHVTIAPED
jgi:2Fe-2S ferredoxin